MATTAKRQATLVGGLVVGLLSALPIVSAANFCCCLWVVCGGGVAAWLAQQGQDAPLSRREGAKLGLAAGLIGAVVYLMCSIPITMLIAPFERALVLRLVDAGSLPPQFRDYVGGYGRGVARALTSFVFMLIGGSVFSTIGGILGVVLVSRRRAPVPAADVAPPPPSPVV